MPTPYDGKVLLVYWTGQSVGERSIEELAKTIRTHAQNVSGVLVKTSDGPDWQGRYDRKPGMAINNFDDISRWAKILWDFGLEFHAWCVLKGVYINLEANRVREACNTPGVRSMLLDVESGPGYFRGGAAAARDLIQKIRAGLRGNFHLALNFDARNPHLKLIHIEEWLPYVQSLHPMVYHKDFGMDVRTALGNAHRALSSLGKPIVPMLQAYGGVNPADMTLGANVAMNELGMPGVTFFRLGTMGLKEFAAVRDINTTAPRPIPPVGPDDDPTLNSQAVIVRPGEPGYGDGAYDPLPPDRDWQTFTDVHGWAVKYKPTSFSQDVYASYRPKLPKADRYVVEVFIPHRNADARSALYFVIHYPGGGRLEQRVAIDQSLFHNQWVSLGVYDLNPATEDSGQVNMVDFSAEQPSHSIAFSAIRWRPPSAVPTKTDPPPPPPPPLTGAVADGFDPPIGTPEERRSGKMWPGFWTDANPFGNWYGDSSGNGAFHTGADLNLNIPRFNLDRGASVHSVASGIVIWAGWRGSVWRNIIIIEHDPLADGSKVFSRYAHVENIQVAVGQRVARGQQIAVVGMSGGVGPNYHLHFDLSHTDILKRNPGHWPGANITELFAHYIDPKGFIERRRPNV